MPIILLFHDDAQTRGAVKVVQFDYSKKLAAESDDDFRTRMMARTEMPQGWKCLELDDSTLPADPIERWWIDINDVIQIDATIQSMEERVDDKFSDIDVELAKETPDAIVVARARRDIEKIIAGEI